VGEGVKGTLEIPTCPNVVGEGVKGNAGSSSVPECGGRRSKR